MDELVERYIQLDAHFGDGGAMPALDGVRILNHDGKSYRLLFDRQTADQTQLAQAGIEILSRTPMTLEEIFVALVTEKH
jgi:hypothetical protein